MIVEQRTYLFHAGRIPEFLSLYEQGGALALQKRILGNLIGYFVAEMGELNQTVHLWGYDSLDERARRRGELMQEQVWRDFLKAALPMVVRQQSTILLPTSFSPIGARTT